MTVKNTQHLVKDDFRHITLQSGDKITLCTDCLEEITTKGVLVSITASPYEEVQCDHCSYMNPVLAYTSEIALQATYERIETAGRVTRHGTKR